MSLLDIFRRGKKEKPEQCLDSDLERQLSEAREKAKCSKQELEKQETELHASIVQAIDAGGAAHQTISSLPEGAWRELQARMAGNKKQEGMA